MLFIAAASLAALADSTTDFRWQAAGQIDPGAHGVADLGVRRGAWSAQLLTDTLDLRFAPEQDRGRAWVALRAELGAVALLIAPWADGAYAPEQGFSASYLGGETGLVRYGAHGLYAGVAGHAYRVSFSELAVTQVEVPAPTPWLSLDAVAGLYRDKAHAWVRVGGQHDALGDPLQPHIHATVTTTTLDRPLGGVAELRAGTARGQSILTRTRVGGLNPYVVPLAGAGWGEWWSETYAIARLGPQVVQERSGHTFRHQVVVDGGVADDQTAGSASQSAFLWGLGSLNRWSHARWFADLDLGWAVGVPREADTFAGSLWFAIGQDWG